MSENYSMKEPMSEYNARAGDGVNGYIRSSRLKEAMRSMYHFMNYKSEETDATKLGTAVHTAVFEPDKFAELYSYFNREDLPQPNSTMNNKENKAYKQELEENYIVLERWEYDMCLAHRNEVMANPYLHKMIQTGTIEESHYWQDEESGLYFMSRPDMYVQKAGIIADFKSCTSASPKAFSKDSQKYDYPFQAIHQIIGAEQVLGMEVNEYWYIAGEKKHPYTIQLYRIDDYDLGRIRHEWRNIVQYVAKHIENGTCPSYEEQADNDYGILDLDLNWYLID